MSRLPFLIGAATHPHCMHSAAAIEGRASMTPENRTSRETVDDDGWVRESDGSLRLWPMAGYSCRVVDGRVPAIRIDYLQPRGTPNRTGKLQLHMSPQQARLLCSALMKAIQDIER